MKLRAFSALGVLAASLTTLRAFAEPSEADKRLEEGTALYEAGKLDEALSKFVQACALAKTESCTRYVALTELKLGRWVDGQRDLKAYLARFPPADRAPYDALLKDAYEKTGHLKIKADDGAQIVIDSGDPVGTAPLADEIAVTPGKHTVLAKRKGVSFGRDVEAPAGKVTTLTLVHDEDEDDDDTPDAKPKPKPKTEKYRAAGAWIGGGIVAGLGVIGLGVGIGAAIASQSSRDDVNRLFAPGICAAPSPACSRYRDAVESMNTAAALSITGYVASGVLLATGFLVWAIWPKAERPIVVPAVTPTSVGAALTGTF